MRRFLAGRCSRGSGAASLLISVTLAGCAFAPARTPQTASCRDALEALDAKVARAEVRDAGAHRIEGFPYLRSDRFIASFSHELTDEPRWQLWLELLRQRDYDARHAELLNLGVDDVPATLARIEECGHRLVQYELADPPARERVRKAASDIPDDYSLAARVLGLYPLAVPFLHLGIRGYHREVEDDYAKPVEDLSHPGVLVLWQPPPADKPADAKAWLAKTDALGIPKLTAAQWQQLAQANAPAWWIEQSGDFDLPGEPQLDADQPRLDRNAPTTYFQPSYTRFAGKVLAQIVYTVWFSERPKRKRFDPYAGALDGVVWRVTLDADGQPLVYDTIHPCGCYHQYFPVWRAARRPQGGFWQERALFPQKDVPAKSPIAVRVQSGTHHVRRVVRAAAASANETKRYALVPYSELLSLKTGSGRRSLFGEDGLVDGSERGERWWLWVSGIAEPGAMRQWGRHPTSFVGRSQFDDPAFLEQLFEVTQ